MARGVPVWGTVPPKGFTVTNLETDNRAVVRFYNKRGTTEPWIKEGKQAVKMTQQLFDFGPSSCRVGAAELTEVPVLTNFAQEVEGRANQEYSVYVSRVHNGNSGSAAPVRMRDADELARIPPAAYMRFTAAQDLMSQPNNTGLDTENQ